MNNDILILLEFLDRCGAEVAGRGLVVPGGDEATRLQRFISGEVTENERAELCVMLRGNVGWIDWVADSVRRQRKNYRPPADVTRTL